MTLSFLPEFLFQPESFQPLFPSTAADREKYRHRIPVIEFRIETPQEYNAPAVPQDYQIRPNLSVIIEEFTAPFR
jgi:hypothetical protein